MATVEVVADCEPMVHRRARQKSEEGLDSQYTLPVKEDTILNREDLESLVSLALLNLYQRLRISDPRKEARERCQALFQDKGREFPKSMAVKAGNIAVMPFSGVLPIRELVAKIPIGGKIEVFRDKFYLFRLNHSVQTVGVLLNVNLGHNTIDKSFVQVRREFLVAGITNGREKTVQPKKSFLSMLHTSNLLVMNPSLVKDRGVALPLNATEDGEILFFGPAGNGGTVIRWRGIQPDSVLKNVRIVYPSYDRQISVA